MGIKDLYDELSASYNSDWPGEYYDTTKRFSDIFIPGNDFSEDDLKLLIRERSNHIASAGQGSCSDENFTRIRRIWSQVYDILKEGRGRRFSAEEYDEVLNMINEACSEGGKKLPFITNRIFSALFPDSVSCTCNISDFKDLTKKLRESFPDYPKKTRPYNWLIENYAFMDYCKKNIPKPKDNLPFAIFSWVLKERLVPNEDKIKEGDKTQKGVIKMETNNTEAYISLLQNSRNLIFHGAPGTGKTFLAKDLAAKLVCNKSFTEVEKDPKLLAQFNSQVGFVQFHPSYDYSDFVEGLRPTNKEGSAEVGFERKDGVFKEFCKKALRNFEDSKKDSNKYVFIIDEINRGEMSKIFGELFFSIDPDYRGKNGAVRTQYANMVSAPNDFDDTLNISRDYGNFFVPENVYIIGTMNDIDRSVESMDFAMRRRFTFVELNANECTGMLSDIAFSDGSLSRAQIVDMMNALNEKIEAIPGLSSSYHIGGSYFAKLKKYEKETAETARKCLWSNHLEPLVKDYLRGMPDAGKRIKDIEQVVCPNKNAQ